MILFSRKSGIVVSLDVRSIATMSSVVEATSSVEGVAGYKIGFTLGARFGLPMVAREVRKLTDLPLIYDHQKAGTDIPQMGEEFAKIIAEAGIEAAIIFPQAGPLSEKAFIEALFDEEVIPIVGGEMTHGGYLDFLREDAPNRMYVQGVECGVENFVVPGNKPEKLKKYNSLLTRTLEPLRKRPCLLSPGFGRQGGDIADAVKAVHPSRFFPIIGTAIYTADNIRAKTEELVCSLPGHGRP